MPYDPRQAAIEALMRQNSPITGPEGALSQEIIGEDQTTSFSDEVFPPAVKELIIDFKSNPAFSVLSDEEIETYAKAIIKAGGHPSDGPLESRRPS